MAAAPVCDRSRTRAAEVVLAHLLSIRRVVEARPTASVGKHMWAIAGMLLVRIENSHKFGAVYDERIFRPYFVGELWRETSSTIDIVIENVKAGGRESVRARATLSCALDAARVLQHQVPSTEAEAAQLAEIEALLA